MEELTPLEKLLSEDNSDPITLYDEENNALTFEQIAVIPYADALFAILRPTVTPDGMAEDEAFVFLISEEEDGGLELVTDEETAAAVFAVYDTLFDEEE